MEDIVGEGITVSYLDVCLLAKQNAQINDMGEDKPIVLPSDGNMVSLPELPREVILPILESIGLDTKRPFEDRISVHKSLLLSTLAGEDSLAISGRNFHGFLEGE